MGSQVLVGPQVLESTDKYSGYYSYLWNIGCKIFQFQTGFTKSIVQSRTAKAHISHISATNFFETKLSPETDSAGLKTSKTAFNLIFPRLLGDHLNFRSNHQYCIPDLGIVAEEFSGAGYVLPN